MTNKLAIIGLGYVGLPLAVEFAKYFPVVGFDISQRRIQDLAQGRDKTAEVNSSEFSQALKHQNNLDKGLFITDNTHEIADANIYIVTVPTPITKHKKPNLSQLITATKEIGSVLKKGDTVIYESTTYPGCTEEDCVPVLEKVSGLQLNADFSVGYSPERINPGDKVHTLTSIVKVTSGSNPKAALQIDALYKKIISAGTHLAPSIQVAEAAKAIENAQRDLNISFANELSMIFARMNIDTHEVLAAAATKWNFLPFKPGLVGGHCIGVDPYYLTHKAQEYGYHPAVILSGRRVNDNMGSFLAARVIKLLTQKGVTILNANILILGITFKANCPDTRNTKVLDVYEELQDFGASVSVYDPWAEPLETKQNLGIDLLDELTNQQFDAIIMAVEHDVFEDISVTTYLKKEGIIFDATGKLPKNIIHGRL